MSSSGCAVRVLGLVRGGFALRDFRQPDSARFANERGYIPFEDEETNDKERERERNEEHEETEYSATNA